MVDSASQAPSDHEGPGRRQELEDRCPQELHTSEHAGDGEIVSKEFIGEKGHVRMREQEEQKLVP